MRIRENPIPWLTRRRYFEPQLFESWQHSRCLLWFLAFAIGSALLRQRSLEAMLLWWALLILGPLVFTWIARILKRRRIRIATAAHVTRLNEEVRCERADEGDLR